jgi:hypothetical protein
MSDIRLVNVVPIVNEWNDAAKKNLDEAKTLMASGNYPDYNAGVVKEGVANLISWLADDLMKAPAVDPESLRPVAHWKVGGANPANGVVGNWKCSLCNKTSLKDSPFCPNCGAKMEGIKE